MLKYRGGISRKKTLSLMPSGKTAKAMEVKGVSKITETDMIHLRNSAGSFS